MRGEGEIRETQGEGKERKGRWEERERVRGKSIKEKDKEMRGN